MLRLVIICCLFYFCDGLQAQIKYIMAGQTDSMICTEYRPSYTWQDLTPPSHEKFKSTVAVDLNEDGITDCMAIFYYSTGPTIGQGSGDFTLRLIPSNWCQILCDSIPWGTQNVVIAAHSFHFGDTMTASSSQVWLTSTHNQYDSSIQAYDYLFDEHSPCFANNASCSYYFAKLIVGADTLLGYMHLGSDMNFFSDWACQGTQHMDTINVSDGITEIQANDIRVFPSPFSHQLNIETIGATSYSLYNSIGALVLSDTRRQLDTSLLALGLYVVAIHSEKGDYYLKVIKTD